MSVKLFNKDNSYFYLTEFGYNYLIKHRNEPPRIRNDYLLHIVIKDTLHFSAFDVPEGKALLICKGQKHHFNVSPGYEHYWFGFVLFGADNRDRTCMVAHRNLKPTRLPVPPYPHFSPNFYTADLKPRRYLLLDKSTFQYIPQSLVKCKHLNIQTL